MKTSIVIPAYNSATTLAPCLTACLQQGAEVVVVDDGSTDNTAEVAQSFPVTLIRQENRGPAAARNAGWRAAKGDVIFFTDADCVPEPGWVQKLLALLESTNAEAAGGGYSYYGASCFGQWIHGEINVRHARMKGAVNFIGSFNAAVRRKALEHVHGFNESFLKPSAEDNDLSYRLKKTGCRLVFDPAIKVEHLHPWGLRRYLRVQARHGFWRSKLYLHHPDMRQGDSYAIGSGVFLPPKGTSLHPAFLALVLLRLLARAGGFAAGSLYWRIFHRRPK
ncbi:MAG: glycosyltransferase [Fibrobacterota bacterium]